MTLSNRATSPRFALRSYLYILVHAVFGKLADIPLRLVLGLSKARPAARTAGSFLTVCRRRSSSSTPCE